MIAQAIMAALCAALVGAVIVLGNVLAGWAAILSAGMMP